MNPFRFRLLRLLRSWFLWLLLRAIAPLRSSGLRVRHVQLQGAPLRGGRPLKVAQLSDLHWESRTAGHPRRKVWKVTPELLAEAVAAVNAAEPDVVVITGDLVEYQVEPDTEELCGMLQGLRCPIKYAILGNHDYKSGHCDTMVSVLESHGIITLRNQCVTPFGKAEPLRLVGLGDGAGGDFRPEEVLPLRDGNEVEDAYTLVLSHNPDTAWRLSQYPIDLQLSGHTHGGQICLPLSLVSPSDRNVPLGRVLSFLPRSLRTSVPGVRVVRHWEWAQGLHKIDHHPPLDGWHWLYTNRGLASRWGLRILCNPEVTIFTIAP